MQRRDADEEHRRSKGVGRLTLAPRHARGERDRGRAEQRHPAAAFSSVHPHPDPERGRFRYCHRLNQSPPSDENISPLPTPPAVRIMARPGNARGHNPASRRPGAKGRWGSSTAPSRRIANRYSRFAACESLSANSRAATRAALSDSRVRGLERAVRVHDRPVEDPPRRAKGLLSFDPFGAGRTRGGLDSLEGAGRRRAGERPVLRLVAS